ncbi:CopG family antitoxin [Acetobacter pasteurianus]
MPSLHSDEAAEDFVATADLTQYDLSGFKPMRFEIEPKAAALNMGSVHKTGTDIR